MSRTGYPDGNAQVGDLVYYRPNFNIAPAKGKVVEVGLRRNNTISSDIVIEVAGKRYEVNLLDQNLHCYFEPPESEWPESIKEVLKDYPNLRPIRYLTCNEQKTFMLLCPVCMSPVSLTQTTIENSEIRFRADEDMAYMGKPEVIDGSESLSCACSGGDYRFDFTSYFV